MDPAVVVGALTADHEGGEVEDIAILDKHTSKTRQIDVEHAESWMGRHSWCGRERERERESKPELERERESGKASAGERERAS